MSVNIQLVLLAIIAQFSLLLSCQNEKKIITNQDESPAVWAKRISINYGVKPIIIDELVKVYVNKSLDTISRRKEIEKLVQNYTNLPKGISKPTLGDKEKELLKIQNEPQIVNILDWDVFLSTTGAKSPAIYAVGGQVDIWYGITPKAFKKIWSLLESKEVAIEDFYNTLKEQIKNYKTLEAELNTYSQSDDISKRAKLLLEEGKLEEASQLLEGDFSRNKRKLAYKAFQLGKLNELELEYELASKWYEEAINLDKRNTIYYEEFIGTLYLQGHYDRLINYNKDVLALDQYSIRENPKLASLKFISLGQVYEVKGEYDRAIKYYENALEINTNYPDSLHDLKSTIFNNLGTSYDSKGAYDKALSFYKKALSIDSIFYGSSHEELAVSYNNIGTAYCAKGKYDVAITYFNKALAIDSITSGKLHPIVSNRYGNLGFAYSEKGKYQIAFSYYQRALDIEKAIFGEIHPAIALLYNNMATAHIFQENYNEAVKLLVKSLHIDSLTIGMEHPDVSTKYSNLGTAYFSMSNNYLAQKYYYKALHLDTIFYGLKHPNIAIIYHNLGHSFQLQEKNKQALYFTQKALDIQLEYYGEQHPDIAMTYDNIGKIYFAQKDYDTAISYFFKALNIDTLALGHEHPEVAVIYESLADIYIKKQEYREALNFINKGIESIEYLQEESSTRQGLLLNKAICMRELDSLAITNKIIEQLKSEAIKNKNNSFLDDLKNNGF